MRLQVSLAMGLEGQATTKDFLAVHLEGEG